MKYQVQTLNKEVSNFIPWNEFIYREDQVKFVLNDLHKTPLPANVQAKFNSVVVPKSFENFINGIHNLKVYEDDTWVISFPRCGSNWAQEAVWQICNNVDLNNKSANISLKERFPVVELSSLIISPDESTLEYVQKMQRPRFIKSHLPIAFLPKELWEVKPKIVYVSRDPKDAAVSWFHFNQDAYLYQGSLNDFLKLYLEGHIEYGDYWDHFEQYNLLAKYCSHFKMIKYEEMKKDLKQTLKELCQFLDKPLTEDNLQTLLHHLSFENMKNNPATNYQDTREFMKVFRPDNEWKMIRKGQVGSFKEEMSSEFMKEFDERTKIVKKRLLNA
uniref:CSON010573 protein n=1 Tax=Culicoides sonorensis TaxID=179676 RepID=A0A336MDZ2_CULSO